MRLSRLRDLITLRGRLDRRGFTFVTFWSGVTFFSLNVVGTLAWARVRPDDLGEAPPDLLNGYHLPEGMALPALWLVLILLFGLALVMFSASVRRLHDMSLSAWGVVLAIVIFAFLPKIELPFSFFSVWEWLWIIGLAVWPGDAGDNVFGARPRHDAAARE